MATISTQSTDLKGIAKYAKVGLLLAMVAVVIASVTGCGVSGKGFQKLAQPADAPQLKTAFLGDSITYLWGQGTQGAADFTPHSNWIEQGVSGQVSAQLVNREPAIIQVDQPKIMHLLTGTNDVYPGWQLCGGSQVYDTCNNIKTMVTLAKANGVQVILATIPPWGCVDADNHCVTAVNADNSADRYARIDTLNAWIKQYGFEQGLIVIDYHSALVAADGQHYKPELTIDGVHPSVAGYAVMTPMAEDAITASELK